MPIQLTCQCGKQLRVPDDYAGRRVKCPACGEAQVAGAAAPTSAPPTQPPAPEPPPPAMIHFNCPCGKALQARAEFAGRTTRCTACNAPVRIPGGADKAPPPDRPTGPPAAARTVPRERERPRAEGRPTVPKPSALAWVLAGVAVLLLAGSGGSLAWWILRGATPATTQDLAYVPADVQGFVSVRVADLWKSEALQKAVQDEDVQKLAEQTKKHFGLGPADVERLTFAISDLEKREFILVLLTTEAYQKDDLVRKIEKSAGVKLEEATARDKTYYTVPGHDTALYFPQVRVIVVLDPKSIDHFLEVTPRQKDGRLAPALKQVASGKHHLVIDDGNLADNPLLTQLRANPLVGAAPFRVLLEARSSVTTASLGKDLQVDWASTFSDSDRAKEAKEVVDGVKFLAKMGISVIKAQQRQFGWNEDVGKALDTVEKGVNNLKVVQTGKEVRASTKVAIDPNWLAEGAKAASRNLLTQMERAGLGQGGPFKAPNRVQSRNNLHQIALAMHAYHAAHNHFPPAVVYSPQGQALYSWRVEILPYLGQEQLYKEWNRNEPWNSPNNFKLLSRMPDVYAMPGNKLPQLTFYKVFTSNGGFPAAPFSTNPQVGRTGPRLTDVRDGTSNTILVVESATAVIWAAPQDEVYGALPNGFPPARLGGHHGDVILAALFDGNVVAIPRRIDPRILQAAITPAGGEKLPNDWARKE